MGYLFDQLHFPDESRMTGVWIHRDLDEPVGEEIALGQLLALRADQDPVVEADFLSSHAPYTVGGLHGVYPDGSGWVFLIQKAPVAAYELVGAADPWWPMIDGLARALDQTPDASTRAHVAWTRDGLLQACVEQGAPWNTIADWPTSRLLWGLLAESCSVKMRDIAQAWPDGCVFGDDEHDCAGDVFTEVFSRWSAGLIEVPYTGGFRIGSTRVRSAYKHPRRSRSRYFGSALRGHPERLSTVHRARGLRCREFAGQTRDSAGNSHRAVAWVGSPSRARAR